MLKSDRFKVLMKVALGYGVFGTLFHLWVRGPRRNHQVNLEDKIVIVTGSSAGIGKETARGLAQRGATVIFACRDFQKTDKIIKEIQNETANDRLFYIHLNLEEPDTIRSFTSEFLARFHRVDILINNAGVNECDVKLLHGIERTFLVNQLGWFTLTQLLLPHLSVRGRIINVASEMHRAIKRVNLKEAQLGLAKSRYAISKYCMISCTKYMQSLLPNQKIVSLCPGAVRTEITDKGFRTKPVLRVLMKSLYYLLFPIWQSESEGAETTLHCALIDYDQLQGGRFYHRAMLGSYSKYIDESNQGKEIYDFCDQLINQI